MRLFFGLSLPDHIRAVTAACALEAGRRIPGRYALPENHHITLAFLGEVPKERLGDACRVLDGCVSFPAPVLTLSGYDHFGRAENGILILRVKSKPALDGLHETLISALRGEGLPADPGPFSPHITLARHAQIAGGFPACPTLSFTAGCAHVYLSARGADGILRYTPLHTVPFRK
ncbi:MAG: RNA 2',3'-cyclic phosphodiesterase [Clostridia bacterium]|nr:RNA 2',3'-cyclic phosphodiesterase [Clostridia bacterium]